VDRVRAEEGQEAADMDDSDDEDDDLLDIDIDLILARTQRNQPVQMQAINGDNSSDEDVAAGT